MFSRGFGLPLATLSVRPWGESLTCPFPPGRLDFLVGALACAVETLGEVVVCLLGVLILGTVG